jgi:hypothetical protein
MIELNDKVMVQQKRGFFSRSKGNNEFPPGTMPLKNNGEAKDGQKANFPSMKEYQEQKSEEELNLLTNVERQVQGVLGEVQYIVEIVETNKKIAPVEDIEGKIKAAQRKIDAYLSLSNDADPSIVQEQSNRRTSGGLDVEQNPLIKEMGGLPPEVISPEWREESQEKMLDKTELENKAQKKLKDRAELTNKLRNRLAAKPKAAPKITPKFAQAKPTVKLIERPAPPAPAPAPKRTPPRPSPFG